MQTHLGHSVAGGVGPGSFPCPASKIPALKGPAVFARVGIIALVIFLISGCAMLGIHANKFKATPEDSIFLVVEPFSGVIHEELKEMSLDPEAVFVEAEREIRYQLYLNKLKETKDAQAATLKVSVRFEHLQLGSEKNKGLIMGKMVAHRGEATEDIPFEARNRSQAHVPESFLKQHITRSVSKVVVTHLLPSDGKSKKSAIPTAMVVF